MYMIMHTRTDAQTEYLLADHCWPRHHNNSTLGDYFTQLTRSINQNWAKQHRWEAYHLGIVIS